MKEAEPLYRQALAIDEKVYGKEHPEVATDLNNLAGLLKAQVLIFSHFCSITTGGYGALFLFQGKYKEAEFLYDQAIKILKNVYGENHPNVVTAKINLADLLLTCHRFAPAETLLKNLLLVLIKSGFERSDENIKQAKSLLQMSKSKTPPRHSQVSIPKRNVKCPCGSGKNYKKCCF